MPILRWLKSIGVFIAALVILFEEWLWEPMKRLMLRFGRLPLVRRLSAAIAGLSPRVALLVYLAPMVFLFPFKIGALWLLAHGHSLLGLTTLIGAKLLGTAIFAWLFSLTRDVLMQIAWFAKAHRWVHGISEAARAWIRRQYLYRWTRVTAARIRQRVARLLKRGA